MNHPVEHLRFPESAVESVAKFRQVAGQMLGTDAMMNTTDIAFNIGDQGMDPGQYLRSLLPRTGHQSLVLVLGRSIQEAVPLSAVSFNHPLAEHAGGTIQN
jgi:hypothetical protein